jgi:dienelactone hydrolase
MIMSDVLIPTPRGQMPARLAVSAAPGPVPGVVVPRINAIGYDEASTMDARRRIAAFFHTHLGG